MAETLAYTVDLTKDEAIALVMLNKSGVYSSQGFVASKLVDIAAALESADPKLERLQFEKWGEIGQPAFELRSSG